MFLKTKRSMRLYTVQFKDGSESVTHAASGLSLIDADKRWISLWVGAVTVAVFREADVSVILSEPLD